MAEAEHEGEVPNVEMDVEVTAVGVPGEENGAAVELRHDFVVRRLTEIRTEMNDRFLEMGQLLLEAQRTGHARAAGFSTFEDFVEATLKIGYRAGKYLMDIFEVMIERLRVPVAQIADVGWTKAKELLPIINDANVQQWLDYARGHKTTEVVLAVKQALHPGEQVTGYGSMSIGVFDDERVIIKEALEIAALETGNERPGYNLARICTDYASEARARQANAEAIAQGTDAVIVEGGLADETAMEHCVEHGAVNCPICTRPEDVPEAPER